MGDAGGPRGAGTTGDGSVQRTTDLPIASASKWFYSSWFVQKTGGVLSADDIRFLNFQSGYTYFAEPPGCVGTLSIDACLQRTDTQGHGFGEQDPVTVGKFDYGGGHMQVHASRNGLGALGLLELTSEIKAGLGGGLGIVYTQPQPAGGLTASAADYATLLTRIVAGALVMRSVLGTHPVCTDPDTCPLAVQAPTPRGEAWHYSIGHWVEDDPVVGDGAFSSPGAFGFYPWIDAGKQWYGVLAPARGLAVQGISCGRLIRRAWLTGVAP